MKKIESIKYRAKIAQMAGLGNTPESNVPPQPAKAPQAQNGMNAGFDTRSFPYEAFIKGLGEQLGSPVHPVYHDQLVRLYDNAVQNGGMGIPALMEQGKAIVNSKQ